MDKSGVSVALTGESAALISRRTAFLAALPLAAQARQPWPARPISMIAPLAAGSSVDILARLLAEQWSQRLGVPAPVGKPTRGQWHGGAWRRRARAVHTAARPDRSSFGCAPQFAVTIRDGCLIAETARATAPAAPGQATAACVRREERRLDMNPPSGPLMVLGAGAPPTLPRFAPRKPDA